MKIITQSVLDRILSWCLISSAKVFISEKVDNTQILVKFLNGCLVFSLLSKVGIFDHF